MVFMANRPSRRRGTVNGQFRDRIPADVIDRACGRTLKVPVGDGYATCQISAKTKAIQFSLRTCSPSEVKVRHAIAAAHVEAFWQSLREGPIRLTHRQVVALAGEAYRDLTQSLEDDPGDPARWEWMAGYYQNVLLGFLNSTAIDSSQGTGLGLIDRLLAKHGLVVDRDSIERLFMEVRKALIEAAERLRGVAEGDFREDTTVHRFPKFESRNVGGASTGSETITGLLEGWWTEGQAAGIRRTTYVNYGGAVRKLVEFLGHDDAHRVTASDIVAFKDHRLAQGISPRTVKDADLAALKSVFGWAKANLRIAANPAERITLRRVKSQVGRPKWFSPDEAKAILNAAAGVTRGQETEKVWSAKRWIPWVLAYTGARVGEIAQLRREDLHRVDDHWEIEITPDAGTVKTGSFRRVPLHPHLVELGFPEFVLRSPHGHLFVEPNDQTGDVLGPLQGLTNRLAEFARQYVPDQRVSPNHGWRHLFIHMAREVGMSEELRNMITGHAGKTVAAREYGGPAGLYREICKFPRFDVAGK